MVTEIEAEFYSVQASVLASEKALDWPFFSIGI